MSGPTKESLEELLDGKKLGHYRIESLIGRGGMGVVFRARDTHLGRRVAIKVLEENSSRQEEMFQRFVQEARLAAQLSHPNVVTIHEVNQDGQHTYIVMELLDGGSLQDRLDRDGKLDWQTATRSLRNVCLGLEAAHARGLIHRDIKPGNILVDRSEKIKLGDFGLARVYATDTTALTSEGMVIGTPLFMSPEQCEGRPADRRSDIYSLGATFYALLTNAPPFPGKEPLQVAFAHCSAPLPDPRAVDAAIPEGCCSIVRRAMAKKPGDRYQRASEMLADVDRCLKAAMSPPAQSLPTIQTGTTSRIRKSQPRDHRSRVVWAAGILLGVSAVLALGFALSREAPIAESDQVVGDDNPATDFAALTTAEKLAALFAAPDPEELKAAHRAWKGITYKADGWHAQSERDRRMKLVSHRIEGERQYVIVRYPDSYSPDDQYPTVVYCRGTEGDSPPRDVQALRMRIPALEKCLLVMPTFRGHSLTLGNAGRTIRSEGSPGNALTETTDVIAFLDMLCAQESQVDFERIMVIGTGSRAVVALQLAIRDERIKAVIATEADSDCFQVDIQLAIAQASTSGVAPSARLATKVWREIAKPLLEGNSDLDSARLQLLSLSPARFVSYLPQTQVYYGALSEDYELQQASAFREQFGRNGMTSQHFAFRHFAAGPTARQTVRTIQWSANPLVTALIDGRLPLPRATDAADPLRHLESPSR